MSYIGNQPTSVAFPYDTFSGTGSQTAYTMQLAPANTASVMVFVSGVKQDPSTYSVSGTTLTFSAAPPSGSSNISAIYLGIPASGVVNTAYRTVTNFTATAGQTTFTPPSYTAGYIDVYRNGVKLALADFTATNGTTVVLASGATAGDVIETDSFYVSSVVNAIPATANSVNQTYIATGVAGTGPAFYAYSPTVNAISANTNTKVALNTTLFDTNSCFNTSTYRFTPNVAGYYQFASLVSTTATNNSAGISFAKNGSMVSYSNANYGQGSGFNNAVQLTQMLYLNGSTDYVELYYYCTGSSSTSGASYWQVYMTGFLARAA